MPPPGKSDLLPPSKSGASMRHHRASPICCHRANSELQCATTGQVRSTATEQIKNFNVPPPSKVDLQRKIADLPKEKEAGASLMGKNPRRNQNVCEYQPWRFFDAKKPRQNVPKSKSARVTSPGALFACTSAPIANFGTLARLFALKPRQWRDCLR